MAQFIVLFDPEKQAFVRSDETIQSITGSEYNAYNYEVGPGGQTDFVVPESLVGQTVDVFVNGILQRQGASYDYIVSGTDTIQFSFTIPENAWVSVRVFKITSIPDYNHFDVGVGGQTQFVMTAGTIASGNNIEVYENGIVKREGGSYDYVRNIGANAIDFNYTIQENAWVLVKVSDT